MSLKILEIDYSVSPGGVNEFEVYSEHDEDLFDPPIFTSTSLIEAVQYAYSLGQNFTVYTLAEYHKTWDNVLNENQLALPLEY